MAPSLIAFPLAVWERDGLAAALRKARLPSEDIGTSGPLFWRFSTGDDVPVGFGGLEVYGEDALMRSVVTLPPLRGRGVGAAIVAALEVEARVSKCSAIYLLTTTAQGFFEKLGYATIDRAQTPVAIRASTQFSKLCPDSAVLMLKRLG
jgi:N-acetylglutamate synthase-like GNAT family acetyltransferase